MRLPLMLYALRKAPRAFKGVFIPCTGVLPSYTGPCFNAYGSYYFSCYDANDNPCGAEFRTTTYNGCGYYAECCVNGLYRDIWLESYGLQLPGGTNVKFTINYTFRLTGYDLTKDGHFELIFMFYNHTGNVWTNHVQLDIIKDATTECYGIKVNNKDGYTVSRRVYANLIPLTALNTFVTLDITIIIDLINYILEIYVNNTLIYSSVNDTEMTNQLKNIDLSTYTPYSNMWFYGTVYNIALEHILKDVKIE